MTSNQRALFLKLAASVSPLAVGVSMVMKKADYSVVAGDSLSAIAKRNGTTWQELAKLNGLKDPNKLQPGQRLRMPARRPVPASQPATVSRPVQQPVIPPAQAGRPVVADTPTARLNYVGKWLHENVKNPNLEAGILANFDYETGGKFSHATQEVGGGGHGLPQFSGATLKAYKAWLAQKKLTDSTDSQLRYFTGPYMAARPGYKEHTAPGAKFTPEQQADWVHRSVETPAHTIQGNPKYNPAMIVKRTLAHNNFIKNRIRLVNGIWQGVEG